MWPGEPTTVCVGVCVCAWTAWSSLSVCLTLSLSLSLPPSPTLVQPHSEEPGGDSRGCGSEGLTAATCHISRLKFGRNQFGTLIRSMTPTVTAAGELRPLPPPQPHTHTRCPDEESNPRRLKSSILNHFLQTNGISNLAGAAKLNYYWIDKKLLRIYLKEGREG